MSLSIELHSYWLVMEQKTSRKNFKAFKEVVVLLIFHQQKKEKQVQKGDANEST